MKHFVLAFIAALTSALALPAQDISLSAGMVISQTCNILTAEYRLNAPQNAVVHTDSLQAVLTITGDNITVDFQGATLRSTADPTRPDLFAGLGILVRGQNVTIRNLKIHGYKVALLADDSKALTIENSDFSYNYRPRLRSIREREDFSDWLSYHNNEHDEWLRYGAGIYLKNCNYATVKNCLATGNQNALLMTGCNDGLFYNNMFHFNSGLGIGMYRSSRNRIMHNRLDWNVRGYSHGFYQRGQDSAAILVYEQCNNNTFAFNSCTHSGDGFFLWAGQHTMDTGEGGCNDNLIFSNDFSYAPTNGVEVTFSRNTIQGNTIRECTYGIWGGYSFNSLIMGNGIMNCRTAIAIEHGQNDTIKQNFFQYDSTGIQLWARAEQPADWGYAQKRDTRSRNCIIDKNLFMQVRKPLQLNRTENTVVNGENYFIGFEKLLSSRDANYGLRFLRNQLFCTPEEYERVWEHPELGPQRKLNFHSGTRQPENPYAPLDIPVTELHEPSSLPDGMLTELPKTQARGRKNIIVGEWGPYDFQRPIALLSPVQPGGNKRSLQLYGPAGQWNISETYGIESAFGTSGNLPDSIVVVLKPGATEWGISIAFQTTEQLVTEFGQHLTTTAQSPYIFGFKRFEKTLNWNIHYFNYKDAQDPLKFPEEFDRLLKQKPVASEQKPELYHAWWGRPANGVQEDHFATVANTDFDILPGRYKLELSSDDGVRLYLDGRLLLEHWDVHEPAVDEIEVELSGRHNLRVEHFDAGGFATLDLRIVKL